MKRIVYLYVFVFIIGFSVHTQNMAHAASAEQKSSLYSFYADYAGSDSPIHQVSSLTFKVVDEDFLNYLVKSNVEVQRTYLQLSQIKFDSSLNNNLPWCLLMSKSGQTPFKRNQYFRTDLINISQDKLLLRAFINGASVEILCSNFSGPTTEVKVKELADIFENLAYIFVESEK